ncbi:TonB-dependent receptor [Coraliomargarita algicola]|uniref:TonB-dependent receptor n=1 Tax=Coraliomargarita algicola TaxID=3092156 RepID=A0ABZ0RFH2_9BACT|nr:TonB-dependent receptor [Coraliomargarita sp. J2-16]WPJ94156.1 TonB-dependent receptor [Coraliomargarita sp. J2-16]
MKITNKLTIGAFAALFLAAAVPASAEETELAQNNNSAELLQLDAVYIYGDERESSVDTITGEELERSTATSLNEIFKSNPQVSVGGGGLPVAQKVYVRGINDSLLNVSIDGATQAGEVYHHQSRVFIDPMLLKVVQVEAGAGAATNGPGALGGAIRYETKDPSDLLREGQDFGFLWKNSYYSNTDGWKSTLSVYGNATSQLDYLVTASMQKLDDFEDGDGDKVDYSSSDQLLGYLKFGFQHNDVHRSELSYERSEESGNRYNRPNMLAGFGHPVQPNSLHEQTTVRDTVTFNHTFNPDSEWVDGKFTLYYTSNDFERDVPVTEPTYGNAGIESIGFDFRNTSIMGAHSVTYGIDARHDEAYANQINAGFLGIQPDGDENALVYGVYLQDNWDVNEHLLLTAGARLDRYEHEDVDGDETEDTAFSPNVGFKYFVSEELTLYANASRVERGLGVSEAYFSSWADTGDQVEKEVATNYELGFNYEANNFSFGVEVFDQKIEDVVNYSDGDTLGDIKTQGYSAHFGYSFNQWYAQISVSEADPELDGETVIYSSYASASGRTWVFELDYAFENADASLGWRTRLVEGMGTIGGYEFDTYATSDIFGEWSPTEHVSVTLSINNLFDRDYKDHLTLYNSSPTTQDDIGRDIRLSVAYKF